MSKLKDYYLNNLTEDEINEFYEYFEHFEITPKDFLASQLEEDKGIYPTYPYDS